MMRRGIWGAEARQTLGTCTTPMQSQGDSKKSQRMALELVYRAENSVQMERGKPLRGRVGPGSGPKSSVSGSGKKT